MFVWVLISVAYVFGNSIRFIWQFNIWLFHFDYTIIHSVHTFMYFECEVHILNLLNEQRNFRTNSIKYFVSQNENKEFFLFYFFWTMLYLSKAIISFWSQQCIPCVSLIFSHVNVEKNVEFLVNIYIDFFSCNLLRTTFFHNCVILRSGQIIVWCLHTHLNRNMILKR